MWLLFLKQRRSIYEIDQVRLGIAQVAGKTAQVWKGIAQVVRKTAQHQVKIARVGEETAQG